MIFYVYLFGPKFQGVGWGLKRRWTALSICKADVAGCFVGKLWRGYAGLHFRLADSSVGRHPLVLCVWGAVLLAAFWGLRPARLGTSVSVHVCHLILFSMHAGLLSPLGPVFSHTESLCIGFIFSFFSLQIKKKNPALLGAHPIPAWSHLTLSKCIFSDSISK